MKHRPRFKGLVLAAVAGASLIAAVVLATLWPFSRGWYERVSFGAGPHLFTIDSLGGQFRVVWIHEPGARRRPWAWRQRVEEPPGTVHRLYLDHGLFGFGFTPADNPRSLPNGPPGATLRSLGVPYWFGTAVMLGLPVWGFSLLRDHRRAERRERQGQCRRCGYDLRATPGRCPECGFEVGSLAAPVLDAQGSRASVHPFPTAAP